MRILYPHLGVSISLSSRSIFMSAKKDCDIHFAIILMRQGVIDHPCGRNQVWVNPFLPLDLSNDAQIDTLAPPTHLHLPGNLCERSSTPPNRGGEGINEKDLSLLETQPPLFSPRMSRAASQSALGPACIAESNRSAGRRPHLHFYYPIGGNCKDASTIHDNHF